MTKYFVKRGEKIHGPFSEEKLRSGLKAGKLTDSDLASESQAGPWGPLSESLAHQNTDTNPNLISCPDCNGMVSKNAVTCPHCGTPLGKSDTLELGFDNLNLQQQFPQQQFPQQQFPQQQFPQQQLPQQPRSGPQTIGTSIQAAVAKLNTKPERKEYYEKVFTEIESSGGGFQASWNWYSFFFGAFLYMHAGLWVKAILMFAACFIFVGVPAPFFWLYCGLCFNYDLYLKKVKNKDLW